MSFIPDEDSIQEPNTADEPTGASLQEPNTKEGVGQEPNTGEALQEPNTTN